MAAPDPNMRCTCGFRIFRESRVTEADTVEQWVLFDSGSFSGFGSTPFGMFWGSGTGGDYGLFETNVSTTSTVVSCENCARVRSRKRLSSLGIFGSYVFGDSIFIFVTDTTLLGCLSVRFTGELETVIVTPTIFLGTPLPLSAEAPATTSPMLPAGAVVAGVLRARLPDVDHDGEFVVSLVDLCAGTETSLATVNLESSMQVHPPSEADLNGMPAVVAHRGLRVGMPIAQPGSGGGRLSIPFDWCRTVIEYDARFGLLPADDGWTEIAGPPVSIALEPGGSLVYQSDSSTSGYLKEITLPTAFTTAYMYSELWVEQSDTAAPQDGFYVLGDGAPGAAGNYVGMMVRARIENLAAKTLNGATIIELQEDLPAGWAHFLTGMDATRALAVTPLFYGATDPATLWGPGDVGGVNPTLRAAFGDFEGSTAIVHVRNVVVSEPGRFMRALFRSYAAIAAPVLRLYFTSDIDATDPKARFLIRYGSLALGADPVSFGSLSVSATAFFNTRNSIVEVPITLPSLTARTPFWFTVERDWTHADDLTLATVHLVSATVRSS